ncbi:Myosin-9 [Rhizoctonia solani]|uniref:Myosin-9 n=1 Tax=Rhizoctonia solani TaxID=456999 RepID=A0A0K6FV50_9AGAM|nr:Myosin-9 [Rhizoctonia solani]
MSAVVQPIATSSHHFTTAADKEALVQFWRSGIEYLAQGITAHQNITRETRISELYSHRASPDDAPIPSLDARISLHKDTLESCVLALAELASSGLARSSMSHQTQQSPSLETRIATLESQMKGFQTAVQPLDSNIKTLTSNLTRTDSRIKACEEKVNTTARAEKSHKELESRVVGLSAQVASPPPKGVGHYWVNERLELMDETVQASQGESEKLKERISKAEARITDIDATRTRVDAHGTKLALLEGRISVINKDVGEIRTKTGSLSALVPESKALLSTPGQIKQVGHDIQNLKELQEVASARLDSLGTALEVVEKKLGEQNEKKPTSDSTVVDKSGFDQLKQQVSSLVNLSTTMDRLQASVAELAPLKLHSQDLTAVAAQASQLLELISHNGRVQDDITQIRSKLARYSKDTADAKTETTENTRLLNEQVAALSSTHQAMQGEISRTVSQVTQLALDAKRVEKEYQDVSETIGGIDARFKANQVTAQWSQEQLRAIRADLAYLEPLKAQREALLLLSGRTEELMPLSIQLGSHKFQKILKGEEQADTTMWQGAARKLTDDVVAICEDLQQRLGQVEPHVTQLESDASSALEKLGDLQRTSGNTNLQVKDIKESLQNVQSDISPLLAFKPDILRLIGKIAPHCDALASFVAQVPILADDIQTLREMHASDITPMKGEVKKIKPIIAALRNELDDTKGKITPLLGLPEQIQTHQEGLNKLEQKVSKREQDASSSNGPLTIRIPPANRTGGFSLSQSLNTGSSNSGAGRYRASTSNSPKKSSSASQQETQPQPQTQPEPQPSTTLAPSASQTQPPPAATPGGLLKLVQVADELVGLIEKSKQTETEITSLSRSFNRSNKQIEELGDSVHGIDQLMTTVQKKSDDNQVTLKLLEREFQILKDDNAAKVKEIDLKQARITTIENETRSLKVDADAKFMVMEADLHELRPLKEHAETLVAFARPQLSPVSPGPHASPQPESRLAYLDRSAKSATKELISVNTWIQRIHGDIKKCMNMSNEIQGLEGRVRELADSIKTTTPLAAPLTKQAPDLPERIDDREAFDQSIQLAPEQLEGVARAATRLQILEEQIHALRTAQPKLKEDLEQVTSQVEGLVPTIDKVVKPFMDHVRSILSLVPLSNHVPSLVPLIDQVPQLHASIQSLSDRVDAAASAAAVATATAAAIAPSPAGPSPASQLRSPVTDRELSPAEPSNENTALFVTATAEPRPNKRRRTEEKLQSLEGQLDCMQGELDGIVDEVKILCTEQAKAKRMRTGEAGQSRKKIDDDVDNLMDTLRNLFEGQDPWPEQIDTVLGKQWAKVLQSSELRPDAGASSTIAKLCEELEVLKMVVEAHGSGIPAPPSAIDAVHVAWAENLTEKVMADVSKEQAQFKTELEELINKALQPMKKVFKVFKESPDI